MIGRKKFEPDPGQRELVKSLAALGGRHEDIAEQIGMRSAKTLRKHFRKELDRGVAACALSFKIYLSIRN